MNKIYIGIDPGANGGIGVIFGDIVDSYSFSSMSMYAISDFFEDVSGRNSRSLIENVHSMPGQGIASAFTFGHGFGMLEGFLIAAGLPYDRVTPQKWQKEFGLYRLPDETKTAKKNRHKVLAKELFPDLNITHATADALLIAEYARRTYE